MMTGKGKQTPKKGNGKPKDHIKTVVPKQKEVVKVKESDCPDVKECVLTFPQLKTVDSVRFLPRYMAVLSRTEEEGVGMEDLDTLQLELEALLSSVAVRMRTLQGEIVALNIIEEKKDKKGKVLVGKPPLSPGKRSKQEEKPIKKLKEITGKAREVPQPPAPVKFSKVKIPAVNGVPVAGPAPPDADISETPQPEVPRVVLPKNDTPNKFWSSVEPFCAEISSEDIKLLEEQILAHQDDSEYQKVPALGRHYTLKWAQEELLEEQEEASVHIDKKRKQGTELSSMLRRSEKKSSESTAGPLTQRLVSALINENIMDPHHISLDTEKGAENISTKATALRNVDMSMLEKRVRKELEEQGLLDPVEPSKEQADDEILTELKRCQSQLRTISHHNLQQLRLMLKLTHQENIRQDYRKKLHLADLEVMEIYRKIASAKQKKKSPSKKEKEQAWKALKERELILKKLDSLG